MNLKLLICLALFYIEIQVESRRCDQRLMRIFPEIGCNLSSVTFSKPITKKIDYNELIQNDKIMIMKTTVTIGSLHHTNHRNIPICEFPKKTSSDLSLDMFLQGIIEYNNRSLHEGSGNIKAAKVKFVTTDSFKKSQVILTKNYKKLAMLMIINADIIPGAGRPLNPPVDPNVFLSVVKTFNDAIISVGWTSDRYAAAFDYEKHIRPMIKVLRSHDITQDLTFPIRAGNAASSVDLFEKLIDEFPNASLGIWSSPGDTVDIQKLRDLMVRIGWDRITLTLSQDIQEKVFNNWPA